MAAGTQEFQFKKMTLQIANSLTDKDCKSLDYLYDTGKSKDCMSGLEMMKELQTHGHFDYQQPEKLIDILSAIKRLDLVKLVKDYQNDLSKKQGTRKTKKTQKAQVEPEQKASTHSGLLATSLVTALHVHCHMTSLIDETVKELSAKSTRNKKETEAIENIKKCSKHLKESFQKGIEVFNRFDRLQEESQPPQVSSIVHDVPQVAKKIKPKPPPKPEKESTCLSHSNTPSLTSSGSNSDLCSSTSLKTNDNMALDTENVPESCTGDSGYGDSSGNWVGVKLPVPKKTGPSASLQDPPNKAALSNGKEEPVYDEPLPIQVTGGDYVDLDQDTLEEPHKYSRFNK